MTDSLTWRRADLHTHTVYSDGTAAVKQVLEHVARHRLVDVLAITDHDCVDGALEACHLAASGNYPFEVVPGVEISSAVGHVLALWVTRAISPGLPLDETIAAIHAQNGIAVIAHPYDYIGRSVLALGSRLTVEDVRAAGADAIETFNASITTPGANTLAERAWRLLGIAQFGSSDAHSLETIGRGFTRFWGSGAVDLRQALLDRETVAEGRHWNVGQYIDVFLRYRQLGYKGQGTVLSLLNGPEQPAAANA